MTTTTLEFSRSTQAPFQVTIPPGLVDVAYIDGGACAAAASMSISQWHTLVKDGKAPKPAIRKPRFTRWLMSDVRAWLIQFSSQSDFETGSEIVLTKATKASHAAKAKRRASR
jgi:predicted DNA-binding transcriptional regulator AlpA